MSDKGRWYRVYARQVEEHDKFADLTAVELGAWMALRSAAELRDRATIRDRAEALLILKRRHTPRAAAVMDKLIGRTLFDVDEKGRIVVHDRDDHDRQMDAEQTNHRRDHRRSEPTPDCEWCLVERWDRSVGAHGGWVEQVEDSGGVDSPQDVESGQPQPQPASPATAHSLQPQPAGHGLPAADDSATLACRFFLNGGTWLGNREYVEQWEELDRRFSEEWVKGEIPVAFERLHSVNPKVKPWALLRAVEMALAERARADDLERERAEADAAKAERKRLEEKAAAATEEDKRRASIVRRAVGLWIKARPTEPVPTDFDELAAWLRENDPDEGKSVAA